VVHVGSYGRRNHSCTISAQPVHGLGSYGNPKFPIFYTYRSSPLQQLALPYEYFTISNCVFNFNILALVVSEILGRSQIYVRGPCAPCTPPSGKKFLHRGECFTMSNSVFNFNFLAMYTRGPYAPCTPPSGEIFFYIKRVLHNI